ncbi:hypothetical protein [Priestia megaterium]|uniref:hypothetical protein n=1 Tax=Priestia megaterium TaxID=1404 RepID=UPI003C2E0E9A
MENLKIKLKEIIKVKEIIVLLVGFIIVSLLFFFIPTELDTMTKGIFISFNALGLSIPTFIAIRMQLLQSKKLRHDLNEIVKSNDKEKITNFVGLLKLQKYIHTDLNKISRYYIGKEASIHGLYREFRSWTDKHNAFVTPINVVAERLIDDYSGLLELLEDLDPHVQKIVLSFIYSACNEYLKTLNNHNSYPCLGRSSEQDIEVVKILQQNIHRKWAYMFVEVDNILKEIQKDTYIGISKMR